jgi:hypothetical protein
MFSSFLSLGSRVRVADRRLLNYDRMLLDESYEIESSSLKGIAKVCKGGNPENSSGCVPRQRSAAKAALYSPTFTARVELVPFPKTGRIGVFPQPVKSCPSLCKPELFSSLLKEAGWVEITIES